MLTLAVVVILIFRQRYPQRLPRCLRPSRYIKYELFTVESALEEIIVDAFLSSAYNPLQSLYPHSPIPISNIHPILSSSCARSFPLSPVLPSPVSPVLTACPAWTTFNAAGRGTESPLQFHYLLPHPPVTDTSVAWRLEMVFTGDGGKHEFLFTVGETNIIKVSFYLTFKIVVVCVLISV